MLWSTGWLRWSWQWLSGPEGFLWESLSACSWRGPGSSSRSPTGLPWGWVLQLPEQPYSQRALSALCLVFWNPLYQVLGPRQPCKVNWWDFSFLSVVWNSYIRLEFFVIVDNIFPQMPTWLTLSLCEWFWVHVRVVPEGGSRKTHVIGTSSSTCAPAMFAVPLALQHLPRGMGHVLGPSLLRVL